MYHIKADQSHENVRTDLNKSVKKVIKERGNINVRDNGGWTLLYWATFIKDEYTINILLNNGADVNEPESGSRWTPLYLASFNGDLNLVKLFLENGADINKKNDRGWTPFHSAINAGRFDIAELFINRYPVINQINSKGSTALIIAAMRGHLDIVKLLIKHGVDINITNNDGQTCLHSAITKGSLEITKYLIESGANIHKLDVLHGWGSIHFAVFGGHNEIIDLLVEKGIDINQRALDGHTPLDLAQTSFDLAHTPMSISLIKHNALITMENIQLMTPYYRKLLMKPWSPQIHSTFPTIIKKQINALFKLTIKNCQINRLPKDILILIITFIAVRNIIKH
jgi:ankyrin repeat protein